MNDVQQEINEDAADGRYFEGAVLQAARIIEDVLSHAVPTVGGANANALRR